MFIVSVRMLICDLNAPNICSHIIQYQSKVLWLLFQKYLSVNSSN